MRKLLLSILLISFFTTAAWSQQPQSPQQTAANVVNLPSPSPLYEIMIMVRAGSAHDPRGKEGAANLVAQAVLEAGFGDPKKPVTKERLAEITRPWGEAALPQVLVNKQTTTFRVRVPREAFSEFLNSVLRPMFSQPLWLSPEVERLRREALVGIESRLRFEQQEVLGLEALDNYVFYGTPLGHLATGTVQGIRSLTPKDLSDFYNRYYTLDNMFVASSISDAADQRMLLSALPQGGAGAKTAAPALKINPPAIKGRELLIITQPNAIATGLHAAYPIGVTRDHPDYWPLFVGNVFLGTHRDSFGRLYTLIREERGYNYGDYSYVEYLFGRPLFQFPPPTTPRSQQYFSLWIRPVAHEYTHFILKAMTYELDRFVREGLTPEQVAEAKVKARTLYLNYAENNQRQLGYRLDDLFYGMRENGYLQEMLRRIDAVTPEQVNAAIKRHLQSQDLKFIIVTHQDQAEKLASDIAANQNVVGKSAAEYHIAEPAPPEKQEMLKHDERWKQYPMNIERNRIRIVRAEEMFDTAAIPGLDAAPSKPAGAASTNEKPQSAGGE